uniref:Uncharacterized protein n=1 Tax=Rhizophora mucronata TaxID=61149 RepID=A0A2P2NF35_RHIMU
MPIHAFTTSKCHISQ